MSTYRSFFSVLRPASLLCPYLHLLPLSQRPAFQNAHVTVFGSTPNGTLGCTIANRGSAALSLAATAADFFSSSFFFSFASCSFDLPVVFCCCWINATCFCPFPPFLFFIPNVLSTATLLPPPPPLSFFGGIVGYVGRGGERSKAAKRMR